MSLTGWCSVNLRELWPWQDGDAVDMKATGRVLARGLERSMEILNMTF
jgi:hypothetical protein